MNDKMGLVLRIFATEAKDVEKRVRMVADVLKRVATLNPNPIRLVSVWVWGDKSYPKSDCGNTFSALQKLQSAEVEVRVLEHGDLYCTMLNRAIAEHLQTGIEHTIVLSPDASSYLNQQTVEALAQAVQDGALATGVAINELSASVLEGQLANTFALWNNTALLSVGGFDLAAALPRDDRTANYKRGWSPAKNDWVYYIAAGVEEVIPLARLVDFYGPCIAPILPRGKGVGVYEVPDPVKNPEVYTRHIAKMGTKWERKITLLSQAGYDLSFLKGGVLPSYRQF